MTGRDLAGVMLKDVSHILHEAILLELRQAKLIHGVEIQAGVTFGCSTGGLGRHQRSSVMLVMCYFSIGVLVT